MLEKQEEIENKALKTMPELSEATKQQRKQTVAKQQETARQQKEQTATKRPIRNRSTGSKAGASV